jgi:hypothetical protein
VPLPSQRIPPQTVGVQGSDAVVQPGRPTGHDELVMEYRSTSSRASCNGGGGGGEGGVGGGGGGGGGEGHTASRAVPVIITLSPAIHPPGSGPQMRGLPEAVRRVRLSILDGHEDGSVEYSSLLAMLMSLIAVRALQESGSVPVRLLVWRLTDVREAIRDHASGSTPVNWLLFSVRVRRDGRCCSVRGNDPFKLR